MAFKHAQVKDGWFAEDEVMWPGQKFCLKVEKVLYTARTKFQVQLGSVRNVGAPRVSPLTHSRVRALASRLCALERRTCSCSSRHPTGRFLCSMA